jgi:hypothetical protein
MTDRVDYLWLSVARTSLSVRTCRRDRSATPTSQSGPAYQHDGIIKYKNCIFPLTSYGIQIQKEVISDLKRENQSFVKIDMIDL